MKTKIKRILIRSTLFTTVVILVAAFFLLRFYVATRDMNPSPTGAINDTVFCIKDKMVNVYLFKTGEEFIMVDAGLNEKSMLSELDKLTISPDQVTTILLTHTDGDHIGGLGIFNQAEIFMHREEEQMINGQNGKYFFMRNKWKYQPYKLLDSNDTLTISGMKIKIIHTPGHSPGSSCYDINRDYLFTGDNLSYVNGRFEHFTSFFNMDTEMQEISMKKLPDVRSYKYILTAHHGIVKAGINRSDNSSGLR